jgi:hypothetical protein
LQAQGHTITSNIFAQDNKSAIQLEKNGRKSCGQKSQHIDIRFFFTKDRIENDNITIEHCPTEQMLADFLTKPLQGILFKQFKAILMGFAHISTLYQNLLLSHTSEERVENNDETNLCDKQNVHSEYITHEEKAQETNNKSTEYTTVKNTGMNTNIRNTHTGASIQKEDTGASCIQYYEEPCNNGETHEQLLENTWCVVKKRPKRVRFTSTVPLDVPHVNIHTINHMSADAKQKNIVNKNKRMGRSHSLF